MDIKESINNAKLDLVNHRAFWWFINDLSEHIEIVGIKEQVKGIINNYKQEAEEIRQDKEKNKKWVQRWLSF